MDSRYIKISQGLDCNNICKQVQDLVNKYVQSGKIIDNSFLCISISNVTCNIEPKLPKIKHE